MPKKLLATYLLIFATLLIFMSLSRHTSDRMRGRSAALFAPLWETILSFKYVISPPSSPPSSPSHQEDYLRLQIEKQLLETELAYLKTQMHEQLLLSSKAMQLAPLVSPQKARMLGQSHQKSLEKALQIMECRLKALPARVIFRSLDPWNHSLWINAGEAVNQAGEPPLIALNSPVVTGSAIVGIVDYVGQHQARVRLITDSRLTPSVRAARGGEQDVWMNEQIEGLLQQLTQKKSLPLSAEEQVHLVDLLGRLKQHLDPFKKTWYLAKGVLLGSASPLKIGLPHELRGSGFNYDFPDNEGESRDLRSGIQAEHPKKSPVPILKINDLLVTTGMDGIFPPGLQAAIVTQIDLLKEGDYFYSLKAIPVAGPLEELSLVFVLPPVSTETIFIERYDTNSP